jgi:anion-transporting  ArsA/GET3 family ATPase
VEHHPTLLDRRLVVVTGKGGVGKTTVAAELAHLGARAGLRTIVCEVAGQRRIPALLGHPTAGAPGQEELVAPGLASTTLDPEGALAEWAGQVVRPRALVELALRSRAFSAFVGAAPGARELVTITKAWELASSPRWLAGRAPYDLVVLDAPASGHGLALLRTPRTFAEIARVGPIASQARRVVEALEDPEQTAVVVVATPEETPVNEALELEARLEELFGHGPAAIVVNAVTRDALTGAELALVSEHARAPVATALRSRHRRVSLQAAQLRRLRKRATAPVVVLPALAHGLGPDEVGTLATTLARALRD